jgi:hypothetical protein
MDQCHNYTPVYDSLLAPRRGLRAGHAAPARGPAREVRAVLEIGVHGGCSLRMWEAYFPNARIDGLDLNPACLFQAGRIATAQADQTSDGSVCAAVGALGHAPYDLIVDDGAHDAPSQIAAFRTLLPFLAMGGIYVVEDLPASCHPEQLGDHVPAGFAWRALPTVPGPDLYTCGCGCGGPESLLIIEHASST